MSDFDPQRQSYLVGRIVDAELALRIWDEGRCSEYWLRHPSPIRDETDWHVLAQDISTYWATPNERAIAYQAAGEAIRLLRGEIRRQGDDRCPL